MYKNYDKIKELLSTKEKTIKSNKIFIYQCNCIKSKTYLLDCIEYLKQEEKIYNTKK